MKTKKVDAAGKFGARYGKKLRKNYLIVHKNKKIDWECPKCLKTTVKRESAGVWVCTSCGNKFAGKAYKPV